MPIPELKTARLELTALRSTDTQSVFELFSDANVVRYYDLDAFTQLNQAENLLQLFESRYASAAGVRWAIRPRGSVKLIGTCGFNSWSEKMRNATLGYDLKPEFWGQGLATEAVSSIIQTAFDGQLPCGPLHRIQADTIPGNLASEKVLTKLGFKQEGIRRECAYLKGSYVDMKCFGLLRHEFAALQKIL